MRRNGTAMTQRLAQPAITLNLNAMTCTNRLSPVASHKPSLVARLLAKPAVLAAMVISALPGALPGTAVQAQGRAARFTVVETGQTYNTLQKR